MSTPAVVLSKDLNNSQDGVNLKWAYTALSTIKEITLIYYKNSDDADFVSIEIASGLLRYNLPSGFSSGQSYGFQLQVTDISSTTVYSEPISVIAPWNLAPPAVVSFIGGDQSLKIQLSPSTNTMSSSDTTVEFVLKREDNSVIWIIKPYASNGQYILSASDDARLTNNVSYRVACMFQPSASNTRYTSPSVMSNSITATPSNTPNAPQSVTSGTVGVATRDVVVNWGRPSDFSEWSSGGFSIVLQLVSSLGVTYQNILTNQDVVQFTWASLDSGASYLATVQYRNSFGDGPVVESSSAYIYPTSQPDAPILISASEGDQQSVVVWGAPSYTGQTPITAYKVYKNGSLYTTVGASTYSCTVTGLQNGYDYSFYVVAVNAIGSSVPSGALIANPFGQMSIVSCIATGKTITTVINPRCLSLWILLRMICLMVLSLANIASRKLVKWQLRTLLL